MSRVARQERGGPAGGRLISPREPMFSEQWVGNSCPRAAFKCQETSLSHFLRFFIRRGGMGNLGTQTFVPPPERATQSEGGEHESEQKVNALLTSVLVEFAVYRHYTNFYDAHPSRIRLARKSYHRSHQHLQLAVSRTGR